MLYTNQVGCMSNHYEIFVPANVVVKVMSTPVLGGITNKAAAPTEVPCHTLYINATCVFGGVDIK